MSGSTIRGKARSRLGSLQSGLQTYADAERQDFYPTTETPQPTFGLDRRMFGAPPTAAPSPFEYAAKTARFILPRPGEPPAPPPHDRATASVPRQRNRGQ